MVESCHNAGRRNEEILQRWQKYTLWQCKNQMTFRRIIGAESSVIQRVRTNCRPQILYGINRYIWNL